MNKNQLPHEWIERIFMRLHGRFGNTFFNKFKIGTLNANGEDAGIVNAKATWAYELAGVTPDRLKSALDAQYEHAPSCDEFKSNCYVRKQVEDYKALDSSVDIETQRRNSEKVHTFVAEKLKHKTDYRAWIKPIIANPKAYPDISLKLAKEVEAMSA